MSKSPDEFAKESALKVLKEAEIYSKSTYDARL